MFLGFGRLVVSSSLFYRTTLCCSAGCCLVVRLLFNVKLTGSKKESFNFGMEYLDQVSFFKRIALCFLKTVFDRKRFLFERVKNLLARHVFTDFVVVVAAAAVVCWTLDVCFFGFRILYWHLNPTAKDPSIICMLSACWNNGQIVRTCLILHILRTADPSSFCFNNNHHRFVQADQLYTIIV